MRGERRKSVLDDSGIVGKLCGARHWHRQSKGQPLGLSLTYVETLVSLSTSMLGLGLFTSEVLEVFLQWLLSLGVWGNPEGVTMPCIKDAVIETAVQSPHLRREELKSLKRMWLWGGGGRRTRTGKKGCSGDGDSLWPSVQKWMILQYHFPVYVHHCPAVRVLTCFDFYRCAFGNFPI